MTQFKDLIFKDHHHMINAHHVFDNNWEISVSAGVGAYCTPREDLIVGWQGREDINNIIEVIIAQ